MHTLLLLKKRTYYETALRTASQKTQDQFKSDQKMIAELESKQAHLRDTLLRISGAVQMLEEMLACEISIEEGQNKRLKKQKSSWINISELILKFNISNFLQRNH